MPPAQLTDFLVDSPRRFGSSPPNQMARKRHPAGIRKRRGGRRPGAGRKPKGERAGVSHKTRAALAARFPVLVTVRLDPGLPLLRDEQTRGVLQAAFAAGSDRFGFRLVHYSIQANHLHLLCEGNGQEVLARGLQGLLIRVGRALNRLWGRHGKVFADRYAGRILKTPRAVRDALCSVLNNARVHAELPGETLLDPFASGFWFDGWKETGGRRPDVSGFEGMEDAGGGPPAVARARTKLLAAGWRKCGLLGMREVPAAGTSWPG